jgi:hypothetical protein
MSIGWASDARALDVRPRGERAPVINPARETYPSFVALRCELAMVDSVRAGGGAQVVELSGRKK